MNKFLISIIALSVLGAFITYFLTKGDSTNYESEKPDAVKEEQIPAESDEGIEDGAEPLPEIVEEGPVSVIGSSVESRDINAYHFGSGDSEVIFIGGIHGGYSWNTALVAYELVEYLEDNEDVIPDNVKVTVIPVVNPDGLYDVVGTADSFKASDVVSSDAERIAGRFNSNEVDLNRNFNCEWEENGTWQSKSVSGGEAPFSEPESVAVRDYVESHDPVAVVAWYSAAGGVYASSCRNGTMTETLELTNVFAKASGYKAFEEFDFYEITGDMVNWLAAKNIPAISVLLTNHKSTEWSKNKNGVTAVLNHFAE